VTRRRLGTLSITVAALAVTSCIGQGPSDTTTAAATPAPGAKQISDDGPTAAPRGNSPSALAALPADATNARVVPHTAPDLPGPGHLVGLPPGDVESLLGAPGFRRRDPPAEVWRYAGESCRLFVFLYARPDDASDYRVSHVEVRGASVVNVSDDACFHSLLKERPASG
jgi:hypothetical protein